MPHTSSVKASIVAVSLSPLRVLIVANDPLVRAGLATLLADASECLVVGQMAGDRDVLAALAVYRPDVVLWDLGWEPLPVSARAATSGPARTGGPRTPLDSLGDLQDAGTPVVVLVPHATQVAAYWTAGARGLLLREAPLEALVASLQAVVQGLVVVDVALAAALLPTRVLEQMPLVDPLTRRELDVLRLVAEGLPNKAIADRLHISEHTVKFHLNALMGELGAQSRTEAVVRATRLGLLLL